MDDQLWNRVNAAAERVSEQSGVAVPPGLARAEGEAGQRQRIRLASVAEFLERIAGGDTTAPVDDGEDITARIAAAQTASELGAIREEEQNGPNMPGRLAVLTAIDERAVELGLIEKAPDRSAQDFADTVIARATGVEMQASDDDEASDED